MDRIEKVILRNLVYNEEYLRKVLPFIEPDYFNDRNERVVFEHITKYAAEYNSLITVSYTHPPSPRDNRTSRMPSSA